MTVFPDKSTIDAVLITGPTASGKSARAIEFAERLDGEIVNADSMQVYDTLRVLTARPSPDEMAGIAHHFYGHVGAGETYSTGAWLREIGPKLAEIRDRGHLPIVIGGTGLYFKALTEGLADMPAIPGRVRETWRARLAQEGPANLHRLLHERDPVAASQLNPADGQRIVRALEVLEASGRSIVDLQASMAPPLVDPSRAAKFVVLPERPLLHARIDRRFAAMLDQGAVEEVQALLALGLAPDRPVMRAIGVSQIADMLTGRIDRQAVVEQASAATRQYAKRQMTWFRNQMNDSWQRIV